MIVISRKIDVLLNSKNVLFYVGAMTTFNTANLPASIDSVEKLAVWALSILAEINPNTTVQTGAFVVERVATVNPFFFQNEANTPDRVTCVAYLPLNLDWRGKGRLFEDGVSEVSTQPIPTHYLT